MSEMENKKSILLIGNNPNVIKGSAKYFSKMGLLVYAYSNIADHSLDNVKIFLGTLRDVSLLSFIMQQYKPDYIIYFINDAVTPQSKEKKLGPYIEALSNTLNFLQCLKNYTDPCSVLCASECSEKKDAVSTNCTHDDKFNMQNMSYGDAMNMLETYLDMGTSCDILINSYKKSFFTSAYESHICINSVSYHDLNDDSSKELDTFLLQCHTQLETMDKLL